MKLCKLVQGQRGGGAARVDSGQPQTFIRIPVAQPGEHALVQEHALEHSATPRQLAGEHLHVKVWVERLWTKRIEIEPLGQFVRWSESCTGISKLVDEAQILILIEMPDDRSFRQARLLTRDKHQCPPQRKMDGQHEIAG